MGDLRATASVLRNQYGVNFIAVFGLCYGGGRALELCAASRFEETINDLPSLPYNKIPPVNPMACVAWYPTQYNATVLFGNTNDNDDSSGGEEQMVVMALFAGDDDVPGATPVGATTLNNCLQHDSLIKDYMVKVFPGEAHGFAHRHCMPKEQQQQHQPDLFIDQEFGTTTTATTVDNYGGTTVGSGGSSSSEIAFQLSTSWFETYSRVFLPTVGPAVSTDESNELWNKELNAPDLSLFKGRDVRQEINEQIDAHVDKLPDFSNMTPDDFNTPIDDAELTDEEQEAFEAIRKTVELRGINLETDDVDTILTKLRDAVNSGDDLTTLPGLNDIPLELGWSRSKLLQKCRCNVFQQA